MIVPVTHVSPLINIRRSRLLPEKGQVLVRAGQKVIASDVIGEVLLPGEHMIIDVRRALGLSRAGEAEKLIDRHAGERLQKGDVIAETTGILPRVVRSSADCQIVAIANGQVVLETQPVKVSVKAGLNGTITEVMPERGAVIETNGVLIQGVWGNQQADGGLLLVLAKTPDEELTRARLDVSMRGAVVLAGHASQPDALKAAAELPLRALILASMSADLINLASSLPIPIILIEGFGRIPMNETAFRLLTSNEKRDICINASNWNPLSGERPEIIIPLPANGLDTKEMIELAPETPVRILGAPYQGQIGMVLQVRPGLSTLPSGLHAQVASVQLQNDETVIIPLQNLDVLE
jgi:preprotein translocase subunit YajC